MLRTLVFWIWHSFISSRSFAFMKKTLSPHCLCTIEWYIVHTMSTMRVSVHVCGGCVVEVWWVCVCVRACVCMRVTLTCSVVNQFFSPVRLIRDDCATWILKIRKNRLTQANCFLKPLKMFNICFIPQTKSGAISNLWYFLRNFKHCIQSFLVEIWIIWFQDRYSTNASLGLRILKHEWLKHTCFGKAQTPTQTFSLRRRDTRF